MERFYIYDCQDNVIGNPAGYRTHRGALREADKKNSKIKALAYDRLEQARKSHPNESLIFRIALGE